MQLGGSSSVVSCNTIVCYFGSSADAKEDEIASVLKDKKQTSFLLSFLKPLSPNNIECEPNWLVITCSKQIYDHQIQYINETLQDTIKESPEYKPLTHVSIMLKITFELCILMGSINGMRERLKHRELHSSDMDNFLYSLTLQVKNVNKNENLPINVSIPTISTMSDSINSPNSRINTTNNSNIQRQMASNANANVNVNEMKQNELNNGNSGSSVINANNLNNPHQRSLSTHIRSLDIDDIDISSKKSMNNGINHTMLSFSDALLYDLHKRKKQVSKLKESGNGFNSYFRISKATGNSNIFAINSGSKPIALPQPQESILYPMQLYLADNDIPYFEDTIMTSNYKNGNLYRNNYVGNNNFNNNGNNRMTPISRDDFIDKRRFHLKTEIVGEWVRNRLYLMKANNLSVKMIEEHMVKYNYKRIFDIIDVRCHDFVGGNIPNCYHVSFEEFDECMPQLLTAFQYHSDLIFHCMYSQHRGPRAAYKYWAKRREWEALYPQKLHKQRIWVLDGGFKKWLGEYILDTDLVANFDAKYWEEEFFPLTGREFFYNDDWKPKNNDD